MSERTIKTYKAGVSQILPGVFLHMTLQSYTPGPEGEPVPGRTEDIEILLSPELARELGEGLVLCARSARSLNE